MNRVTAPDTFATGAEKLEFVRIVEFFGKKVVRIIKRTETIRTPFAPPKIIPQNLSTHPKKAMLKKYLIRRATREIKTRIAQKRIKKLSRFLYPAVDIHFAK